MQVRWHGHACFEFSNDDVVIVTDPHDGKSIGIKQPCASADIILISHDHYDHNMSHVIEGNYEEHKFHFGKFESHGIEFLGIETYHDKEKGTQRGMNTMYRFSVDGISICHCGDLGDIPSDEDIAKIKNVDFLFLPVGGYYTMENDDLKSFIEKVNPRIVVPMHYRFGGLTIPIASVDNFLQLIPKESIEYIGNSFDVTIDDLPDEKECWVFDRK